MNRYHEAARRIAKTLRSGKLHMEIVGVATRQAMNELFPGEFEFKSTNRRPCWSNNYGLDGSDFVTLKEN